MKRSFQPYMLALVALGALAACEKKAEDEAVPADTAAMAPAPAPPAVSPEPVVIDLDQVKGSGIKGEATATHSATDVTVSIVLKDGAKADVEYPAHIHTGTCDKGGPVAVELTSVKNMQSTTTVPTSKLTPNQDAFVQVHDPKGTPVACGNLKGHGEDANLTTPTTTSN